MRLEIQGRGVRKTVIAKKRRNSDTFQEINMTTIDLTIHKDRRARAVQRARERNIIIPTYAQMKDPSKIPAKIKEELKGIGLWDIHPRNLFRITWKNQPTASGALMAESIFSNFHLR